MDVEEQKKLDDMVVNTNIISASINGRKEIKELPEPIIYVLEHKSVSQKLSYVLGHKSVSQNLSYMCGA